jgi:HAD superfamily hydrolase (TIGR01509 family)
MTAPSSPTVAPPRPAGLTAVVFDWGGTLTPFHDIDLLDLWRVAADILAPERAADLAAALASAERAWWDSAVLTGRSGTTADVLAAASAGTGIDLDAALHEEALSAHLEAWTEHTITDPEAAPLLHALRERGLRTGLLSNTHWPRAWHERWLERDGILDLLDARVYTSELAYVKPHAPAFQAVLDALGVTDAATAVFVGDRPHDDISGAKAMGMRAVLVPNSVVPAYDVIPDATVRRLSDLLPLVDGWLSDLERPR